MQVQLDCDICYTHLNLANAVSRYMVNTSKESIV